MVRWLLACKAKQDVASAFRNLGVLNKVGEGLESGIEISFH